MSATQRLDSSLGQTLFMALELGQRTWKLAFSPGLGDKARYRTMAGGDVGHLTQEIAQARKHFGLPDEEPSAATSQERSARRGSASGHANPPRGRRADPVERGERAQR
jgi:hypothetical protein